MDEALVQLRKTRNGAQLNVAGKPFIMLAGELHNSSASSLAYMEAVWDRVCALGCNTALAPVSWELIEPEEGRFDFTLVEGLVEGARHRCLKLVLLWFGSYKNAYSTYTPAWVKKDLSRFFRAEAQPARKTGSISCFCEAACEADARAFAALLRHLRALDESQGTVLMVQVENETGILGAARDHCPQADAAFHQPVPRELIRYLQENQEALHPWLAHLWQKLGRRTFGTWTQTFGESVFSEEVFMAWHIARFVGRVAQAGRAEYPLPMFANAWLVQHPDELPGQYPSGGPVSRMIDIWRCAAPALDLIAPDIYIEDFAGVCGEYHRPGNPLLIPEAALGKACAARAFFALAEHDALCFAPFGIEGMAVDGAGVDRCGTPNDKLPQIKIEADGALLAQSYRLLANMLPLLAQYQGTGNMRGILQGAEARVYIELGEYRLRVEFGTSNASDRPTAGGLVIALPGDEFLVVGFGFSVQFLPRLQGPNQAEILELWEGDYLQGEWVPGRRLNGDELALRLGPAPGVRRIKMHQFA